MQKAGCLSDSPLPVYTTRSLSAVSTRFPPDGYRQPRKRGSLPRTLPLLRRETVQRYCSARMGPGRSEPEKRSGFPERSAPRPANQIRAASRRTQGLPRAVRQARIRADTPPVSGNALPKGKSDVRFPVRYFLFRQGNHPSVGPVRAIPLPRRGTPPFPTSAATPRRPADGPTRNPRGGSRTALRRWRFPRRARTGSFR